MKAYCSVKEHADWELWKAQFVNEKVRNLFRRLMDLISIFSLVQIDFGVSPSEGGAPQEGGTGFASVVGSAADCAGQQ